MPSTHARPLVVCVCGAEHIFSSCATYLPYFACNVLACHPVNPQVDSQSEQSSYFSVESVLLPGIHSRPPPQLPNEGALRQGSSFSSVIDIDRFQHSKSRLQRVCEPEHRGVSGDAALGERRCVQGDAADKRDQPILHVLHRARHVHLSQQCHQRVRRIRWHSQRGPVLVQRRWR